MNETNTKPKRLTPQIIRNLAEAHARLVDLGSKKIVEKGDDKETAGLANFIGNTMLDYAPEFLGAWQLTHMEYQPLIIAVGKLLMRASAAVAPPPTIEAEEVKEVGK